MKFDEVCSVIRKDLRHSAAQVKALKEHEIFGTIADVADKPEMTANIMLAYRHLEDAAMRLGKAIQAFDGGKSVYEK